MAKKMAFFRLVACVAAFFLPLGLSQYTQDYERYAYLVPSPPAGGSNYQTRYRL